MPSPCAALTSAACFSSARTASRLPCMAASATGALGAAYSSADKDSAPMAPRITFLRNIVVPSALSPKP